MSEAGRQSPIAGFHQEFRDDRSAPQESRCRWGLSVGSEEPLLPRERSVSDRDFSKLCNARERTNVSASGV